MTPPLPEAIIGGVCGLLFLGTFVVSLCKAAVDPEDREYEWSCEREGRRSSRPRVGGVDFERPRLGMSEREVASRLRPRGDVVVVCVHRAREEDG